MEGTARLFVNKNAEGFIVVVAESLKKEPWWLYHTLIAGGDSLKTHGIDDVDNFAVYDAITRKLVVMIGDGKWAHVFRIHDGNHVNISKRSDTEAGVELLEKSTFFGGLHTCEGRAHSGCDSERTLKLNSQGLSYAWELPKHLAEYKAQKDVKW